jgi:hypothetical protein
MNIIYQRGPPSTFTNKIQGSCNSLNYFLLAQTALIFKNYIMKKETFLQAIEAIQKQSELNDKINKTLAGIGIDYMPDNHYVENALIDVLNEEMDDSVIPDLGLTNIEAYVLGQSNLHEPEELYRLLRFRQGKKITKKVFNKIRNR